MASRNTGKRNTSGRSGNNYRRRKKRSVNYTPAIVLILFLVAVVLIAVWAMRSCGTKTVVEETTTTVEETKLEQEIMVDGISIKGKTRTEAAAVLTKQYTWNMKAVLDVDSAKTMDIDNLIQVKIDELLDEIYSSAQPKENYSLNLTGMDKEINDETEKIKTAWTIAAKNGTISGFDKSTGQFTYAGEEKGLEIDTDKLKTDISEALSKKDFLATITVTSHSVDPEITEAQAKEMYKTIGTYTTNTTANNDRNSNINLACTAIDGLVLQPGEEFSFNNTTGNRTGDKGYKAAGAYVNGVVVEEPGGGVCQVSSTLYNAVIFSGLQTTERHAHTFEPSYVTPGEDAMVSYDGYAGPDMKFVNTSSAALVIRARYADRKVTMSIIGIPILDEGVTISMHSEKVAEYDEPAPTYIEDQTLQPDVEVLAKAGTKGSRWVTNIITKKDGAVVTDEFFHNSTYKGHAPEIKRNTSGIVITENGETSSVDPSASSETVETVSESEHITTEADSTESSEQGPGMAPTKATTKAETSTASGPTASAPSPTAAPTVAATTASTTAPQAPTSEMVETVPPAPGAP